jgi:hypothetical protein
MTHADASHAEHAPTLNGAGAGFVLSVIALIAQTVITVAFLWSLAQTSAG